MIDPIDALLSEGREHRAREIADEKTRLRVRITGVVAAQVALAATKTAAAQIAAAKVSATSASVTSATATTATTAQTVATTSTLKALLIAHGTKLAVLSLATSAVVYQAARVVQPSAPAATHAQPQTLPVARVVEPSDPEPMPTAEAAPQASDIVAQPRVVVRANTREPTPPTADLSTQIIDAVPDPAPSAVSASEPEPAPAAVIQPPINVEQLRREVQLLARARSYIEHQDFAAAVIELEQHRAAFAQGTLIEEREALLLIAHCRLGHTQSAERDRFRRGYPASAYRARITEACRAVSAAPGR